MANLYGWYTDEQNVFGCFGLSAEQRQGIELLYGMYGDDGAGAGETLVIFRQDGKLFEVHGAHDSYLDLDGQWEPEETTKQALLYRWDNGGLTFFCGGQVYTRWNGLTREFLASL